MYAFEYAYTYAFVVVIRGIALVIQLDDDARLRHFGPFACAIIVNCEVLLIIIVCDQF